MTEAKRPEGKLGHRISLFNRTGGWCGSVCAPTAARALDEWWYLRLPDGRAELGAWDEAARDYVTHRTLTDADLCPGCGRPGVDDGLGVLSCEPCGNQWDVLPEEVSGADS